MTTPTMYTQALISHQVGLELCYWILTDKGTVLSLTRVKHVTIDDPKNPNIADKFKNYTETMDGDLSGTKYIYN